MVIFHTKYAFMWDSGVYSSSDLCMHSTYSMSNILVLNEFLCGFWTNGFKKMRLLK